MKQLLMVTAVAAGITVGTAYAQGTYTNQTEKKEPATAAPATQKPAQPTGTQGTSTQKPAQPATQKPAQPPRTTAGAGGSEGHTTPLAQPNTEAPSPAPGGEMALGAVTIRQRVKANGQTLAPGTYQIRLTADEAKPDVPGQTEQHERWVEFRQGNQVRAKEVVTIVPAAEASKVQKDPPPRSGSYKVEMLKGNDYVRVWINRGGNHYLIYMPPA